MMKKMTSNLVRNLSWNATLSQFVYSYYDPAKSMDPIKWESFDPVEEKLNAYVPKQEVSDNMKRQLGVYHDYVSLAPSRTKLLYLRIVEGSVTALSEGKLIEVWQADKDGLQATKLGELPFLWDQIIWLDNEKRVLLTMTYESVDSGIEAFSFDLENKTFQKVLTSIPGIQGIPSGLSVSPNEQWIALTTYGQDKGNGVWIVDRYSNSVRRIDSAYSGAQPLWSKDSRFLYYLYSKTTYFPGAVPSKSPYIARYDLVSQSIQPLTTPGDIAIPLISEWAVSDDGKHFLFEADSGLGYLDQGLWSLTLNSH